MKKLLFNVIFLILLGSMLFSAPHNGDFFQLLQPDGNRVSVKVWGDEYYQTVEGLDGYTLIREDDSGWICYARVSDDGMDYLSTGLRYTIYQPEEQTEFASMRKETNYAFAKHARISIDSVKKKIAVRKAVLNQTADDESLNRSLNASTILAAPPVLDITGTRVGVTVLIDFPDVKSSIPRNEIINFLNQTGYSNYDNNGSVKDYFYEVSNQRLNYTNSVTEFVTVSKNKSYYDSGSNYPHVTELMYEALDLVKASGFDFSGISTENGSFVALNFLYAGTPDAGWGNGLWPHMGTKDGRYTIDGIRVRTYQMSNIGRNLAIGTFCHESGHLICHWDDLYAYDDHDGGIGAYGVMCINSDKNPQLPNPYFRYLANWISFDDIANDPNGTQYSLEQNGNNPLRYSPGGNEYYVIENRQRNGRSAVLPDSGLLIWHIYTEGDNKYSQYTNMVSVVQADNRFDLEKRANKGGPGDLFHAGSNDRFNDNTSPNAHWYNGSNSGMDIANISGEGSVMTFTLGDGPTIEPTPSPSPTPTPLTSGNIMVRARGTLGGENLEVVIDGTVTQSWILTTDYQNYFANGNGVIEVQFTNDDSLANGMDAQVDYIVYNDVTYQAEDQNVNTAVYIDGACGGSYSELLECNGYIRFDTSSTPTAHPVLLGDVNSDGTIDIVDALLIAQYYVGFNPENFNAVAADVNCDNVLDIVDSLLIAQYYVSLINSFC